MTTPNNLAHKAFQHQPADRIPKGELWLGTALLEQSGLKDDLEGHIAFRKNMHMDTLFLPISLDLDDNEIQGYRYFKPDQIQPACDTTDFFTGVVVDGPFQRMVDQLGLMTVLMDWRRNKKKLEQVYDAEKAKVIELIGTCLKSDMSAVVIADDIAAEQGPYLNPLEANELFLPFYQETAQRLRKAGKYPLLHSCGNFSAFIPELVSCGFSGFAACQCESLDLKHLKQRFGSEITFMTGIRGDLLLAKTITDDMKKSFEAQVKTLAKNGGFILSTSTGVYHRAHIKQLQEIYLTADGCDVN